MEGEIYTIDYEGKEVAVTIEDETQWTCFVRAVDGYPFEMEHGFGLYVIQGGRHYYDHAWINKSDLLKS